MWVLKVFYGQLRTKHSIKRVRIVFTMHQRYKASSQRFQLTLSMFRLKAKFSSFGQEQVLIRITYLFHCKHFRPIIWCSITAVSTVPTKYDLSLAPGNLGSKLGSDLKRNILEWGNLRLGKGHPVLHIVDMKNQTKQTIRGVRYGLPHWRWRGFFFSFFFFFIDRTNSDATGNFAWADRCAGLFCAILPCSKFFFFFCSWYIPHCNVSNSTSLITSIYSLQAFSIYCRKPKNVTI